MAQPTNLTDGSWQDRAFVTIIRKSDQKSVDLAGMTDEFGYGDGQRDFDGQPVSNGGRIRERTAEEDATVNGTLYPVGATADSYEAYNRPRGIEEFFYESGDQNTDKSDVTEYTNSLDREDYLYVVMWTNDPDVTSATDEVGEDYYALRYVDDNITWIDFTPDWSDEVLTVEVEGKRAAFDPDGKPNHLTQEKVPGDTEVLYEVGVDTDGSFKKIDDSGTDVSVDYF